MQGEKLALDSEVQVTEGLAPNFRIALTGNLNGQTSNKVFRSSRLDDLPQEKAALLRSHYGIRTILDLRSNRELDLTSRTALNTFFVPVCLNPRKDPKIRKAVPSNSNHEPLLDQGHRFVLSLISTRSFFSLLGHLPNWFIKIFALFCLIADYICNSRLLHRYVLKGLLNSMGLENFKFFLIDNCKREIGTALQVFTASSRFPLLVNCTQGKDRTGLIIALLQMLLEYDEKHIVSHYAKSYDLLRTEKVLAEINDNYGLSDDWTKSDPETMQHIIEYIKLHYSSIGQYLELCGVTKDEQNEIKQNISGVNSPNFTDLDTGTADVKIQIDDFEQGKTDDEDRKLLDVNKIELKVMTPTSSIVRSEIVDANGDVNRKEVTTEIISNNSVKIGSEEEMEGTKTDDHINDGNDSEILLPEHNICSILPEIEVKQPINVGDAKNMDLSETKENFFELTSTDA